MHLMLQLLLKFEQLACYSLKKKYDLEKKLYFFTLNAPFTTKNCVL